MMMKIKVLTEYTFESDELSFKANKLMEHGGLNSTHYIRDGEIVVELLDDSDNLLGIGTGKAVSQWEWK